MVLLLTKQFESNNDNATHVITSRIKSTHPVTLIPKENNAVRLNNKLNISMDNKKTLNSVTTNGIYNVDTNIVTIDDPTSSSNATAIYSQVGIFEGKPVSAIVSVDNIKIHTSSHVAPKIKLANGSYQVVPENQVAIIFGKSFAEGVDTYNIAELRERRNKGHEKLSILHFISE